MAHASSGPRANISSEGLVDEESNPEDPRTRQSAHSMIYERLQPECERLQDRERERAYEIRKLELQIQLAQLQNAALAPPPPAMVGTSPLSNIASFQIAMRLISPLTDKKCYDKWHRGVYQAAWSNSLHGYLDGTITAPDPCDTGATETYTRESNAVAAAIASCLDYCILDSLKHLGRTPPPQTLWTKVEEMCRKKDIKEAATMLSELSTMRVRDGDSADNWVAWVRRRYTALLDTKMSISETVACQFMIQALPASMGDLIQMLQALPDDEWTITSFATHIRLHSTYSKRINNSSSTIRNSAGSPAATVKSVQPRTLKFVSSTESNVNYRPAEGHNEVLGRSAEEPKQESKGKSKWKQRPAAVAKTVQEPGSSNKKSHSSLASPINPPEAPGRSNTHLATRLDMHDQTSWPRNLYTVSDKDPMFETSEKIRVIFGFEDFGIGLKYTLLDGIREYNFKAPSAIQRHTLAPIIGGRDVIAQAPPGTGKTAAISISVLQSINTSLKEVQAVVISPTPELATQIRSVILALGKHMNPQYHPYFGLGGTYAGKNVNKLDHDRHIIIGTPRHILDMILRGKLPTDHIKLLVLDEVDELLGEGSDDWITTMYPYLLSTQIVAFSTTLPGDVLERVTKLMTNAICILVRRDKLVPTKIKQSFITVEREDQKFNLLSDLSNILTVECLAEKMRANFDVAPLHEGLEQIERDNVIKNRTLITTDVWARGIDTQQVLVINYDIPYNRENYIHRIGRSGRFGRKGIAISLVTKDEVATLRDIEQYYSTQIEETQANAAELF